MARQRMIHPGIWTDEGFAELTHRQQLLYIGLFSNADDAGRLRASTSGMRLMLPSVYPGTPLAEVEEDLARVLHEMTSLRPYEVEGRHYLAFVNYRDWQKISHPTPSRLPPSPWYAAEGSDAPAPVGGKPHGGLTEDSRSVPPQLSVVKLSLDQSSLDQSDQSVAPDAVPPDGGERATADGATVPDPSPETGTPSPGRRTRPAPKPTTLSAAQRPRFRRWYFGEGVAGYKGYPSKQQRPDAEKEFARLDPDDAQTDAMIADVQARQSGRKWSDPRYIDYPAKYLKQRIWEDDIEPLVAVRGSPRGGRTERNEQVTDDWYPGKSLGLPPPNGADDEAGHPEGGDGPPLRQLRQGPD